MSEDEYSYSFLLAPKMMTATSTEQSTDSSWAFLKRPPFRFRKVLVTRDRDGTVSSGWRRGQGRRCEGGRAAYTERFLSSLMALISIFLRPILSVARRPVRRRLSNDRCAPGRRRAGGGEPAMGEGRAYFGLDSSVRRAHTKANNTKLGAQQVGGGTARLPSPAACGLAGQNTCLPWPVRGWWGRGDGCWGCWGWPST